MSSKKSIYLLTLCRYFDIAVRRTDSEAIAVLEILKSKGFKITSKHASICAKYKNMKVFMWLRENGCPWDRDVITNIESATTRMNDIDVEMLRYMFTCKNPYTTDPLKSHFQ